MSTGYRTRQKAIRDEKRRRGYGGLLYGQIIPPKDFHKMQADWDRGITGPPLGTLEDMMGL